MKQTGSPERVILAEANWSSEFRDFIYQVFELVSQKGSLNQENVAQAVVEVCVYMKDHLLIKVLREALQIVKDGESQQDQFDMNQPGEYQIGPAMIDQINKQMVESLIPSLLTIAKARGFLSSV